IPSARPLEPGRVDHLPERQELAADGTAHISERMMKRRLSGASSEKLPPLPGTTSTVQRVWAQRRNCARAIQNSQPAISPTFSSTPPNLNSPTWKHIGALPSQQPPER